MFDVQEHQHGCGDLADLPGVELDYLPGLAATATGSGGVTTGNPFPVAVSWLGTWLQRNPSWDWRTLRPVSARCQQLKPA